MISFLFLFFYFYLLFILSLLAICSLWQIAACQTERLNSTWLRCVCSELGVIAALSHKSSDYAVFGHNHSLHLRTFLLYASCALSLLLLLISLICQVAQRHRETLETSFILISLLVSLAIIQLVFLSGGPFYGRKFVQLCNLLPIFLHYLHLMSAFWMLSHTIYLYQQLWTPLSHSSSSSLTFSESDLSLTSSQSWSCFRLCYKQWNCGLFFVFALAMPALSVSISYHLNPHGYETKR